MYARNRLFSIGVLSKLTGVHIRCCYYEQLGILQPAHIDTASGYRYYTYRQMRIVEAIQYCVELDIPLKKFAEFLSQGNGQIDYESLAEYGRKVTEEKLQSIRIRQKLLEEMQKEMSHAQVCAENGTTTTVFPTRHFYCVEYDGPQTGGNFQSAMVKLINDMERDGFQANYDNGILLRKQNNKVASYCFVDIKQTDKDISEHPQIITVPAGVYKCVTAEKSGCAENLFADKLQSKDEVFIIETELFTGKFPYANPTFELRCYVGAEK
ncbi:MAG: MerR family transcriptional regulator [Ruminococcaceae bacterium]|nr:MerR family transcriptional regulator [Oscillospiraceae bacterium]